MSDRRLAEQLKALGHERAGGSPDARWLASTRDTLLMQVRNTVDSDVIRHTSYVKSLLQAARFFMPEHLGRLALVPAMLLLLVVGANFGSSAVIVASQGTLPGQVLYDIKLAAERVSLKFASEGTKIDRRLEIAARRLDEMSRLAAGSASEKEEKLSRVAGLFSQTMIELRADLSDLHDGADADTEAAVLAALRVDAQADRFLAAFSQNGLHDRSSMRMAILSVDQASVKALEFLVEKQSANAHVLPEATLSSAVGKSIDNFATHVAATAESPLKVQARAAVEEAKELFSNGDFKAAVRKVIEGTDLATQAGTETESATTTSVTTTPEISDSASGTELQE